MKILFICKHNRFRSKVAEVIFKKLDTRNEVKSAGIMIDFTRPWIAENVKKIMNEKGYEIKDEQSREINEQDLEWADMIVIVANNIDKDIFKGKTNAEIEKWEITDADEKDEEKIRKIIGEIEGKVSNLLDSLNE